MKISVNGVDHDVDVEPNMPLLWVLRHVLGLTGTKYGCGVAQCGACTVHVNGRPVLSCSKRVSTLGETDKVTTIEGLATGGNLHKVQQAWIDAQVPQCGYCQSGQIMAACALLQAAPSPTDADINAFMSANLCRCGTYNQIRDAIKRVAGPA